MFAHKKHSKPWFTLVNPWFTAVNKFNLYPGKPWIYYNICINAVNIYHCKPLFTTVNIYLDLLLNPYVYIHLSKSASTAV